jgi:hypothetical protein
MNYGNQGEVFYNMAKDPHQYSNLIDEPDYVETILKARKQLSKRLQQVY